MKKLNKNSKAKNKNNCIKDNSLYIDLDLPKAP